MKCGRCGTRYGAFEGGHSCESTVNELRDKIKALELDKNKFELIAEDLECAHMWLDDKQVPRSDGKNEYSMVGRIGLMLNALSNTKKPQINEA